MFCSFPVGDIVYLIPGSRMNVFYRGLKQMEYPGCCFCEAPVCQDLPELTLLALFGILRVSEFDAFPFPSVIYRRDGAECFRWTSLVYIQAALFNDTYAFQACALQAPLVVQHKTNKTSINDPNRNQTLLLQIMELQDCNPVRPGYISSAPRNSVTFPKHQDFRSITSRWLL